MFTIPFLISPKAKKKKKLYDVNLHVRNVDVKAREPRVDVSCQMPVTFAPVCIHFDIFTNFPCTVNSISKHGRDQLFILHSHSLKTSRSTETMMAYSCAVKK